MKKRKGIDKLRHWIECGNNCEHCPAGWSEYSAGCDEWDGGCYIYGDDWPEPCRLILPRFVRGFLARRHKYFKNHEYDDYGEWYEKEQAAEKKIRNAVEDALKYRYICWKNLDTGELREVADRDWDIHEITWKSRAAYNDFLREQEPYKTLRQRWAELIKETFMRPVNFIKSYICE